MKKLLKELRAILHEAHQDFITDLGPVKAGAIAFFSSLSMVPLGLVIVSAIGHIIGPEEAYERVAALIREYLPGAGEQVVQALGAARTMTGRWLVNLVGIVGLIWGATNLFNNLSLILSSVWTGREARSFLTRRLISFLAVVAAGLLFLATAVLTSVLAALRTYAEEVGVPVQFDFIDTLNTAVTWVGNAGLAGIMFFLLYWLLPAGQVNVKAAAVAGLAAAVLWMISRSVFATLVAESSRYGELYGPLAGAVVLLLWIYYSAYIMIYCAEMGAVLQRRYWPVNNS